MSIRIVSADGLRRFYKKTILDNSLKTDSFLKDLSILKLSEDQKISCEGRITLKNAHSFWKAFKITKLLEMMEFLSNFTKHSGHYSASLSFNAQMNASRKVSCQALKNRLLSRLLKRKEKIAPL